MLCLQDFLKAVKKVIIKTHKMQLGVIAPLAMCEETGESKGKGGTFKTSLKAVFRQVDLIIRSI